MDNANLNPLYIFLLYILRCLVPLGIMLGFSYFLRKFGLIKSSPRPPEEGNGQGQADAAKGDLTHG